MSPQQALPRALLATFIFASTPSCVRAVGLDTFSLGIVRLCMASLAMTLVLVVQRKLTVAKLRRWSPATWRAMAFAGLAFGLHWILFFLSIKIASATVGAIGFSTYGLHLIVLGWLFGYSRVTSIDLLGLALALVGTLLLVPEFSLQNQTTLGLAIGTLSGLAAACLPLIHQRYATVDVHLRTWGQFLFALLLFLCFWPFAHWETFDPDDLLLLLYLGLGITWIGHGLWVQVSSVLSTTTISILSYLYLPASLIICHLALGERLSGRMWIGTVLVLSANSLVLWNQARTRSLEPDLAEHG